MYAFSQEVEDQHLCVWLFRALQGWTQFNSFELAIGFRFRAQRCDGVHAMLVPNPTGHGPLVDAQGLSSLRLGFEMTNQILKDVHYQPSYGISHNVEHGHTHLQGYGRSCNPSGMEFKDRLKIARKHAKLTQTELATTVGISQTSITDLERGKSAGTTYVAQIAKACGVGAIWLATGKGEMIDDGTANHSNVQPTVQPYREARSYPVISWVAAGTWSEACDNFQPGDADEWVDSNENAGRCGYWLEVKGMSMKSESGASFPPGMRILVMPEGFDLVNTKFYIAKLKSSGETTFKQYIRDAGKGYLVPLNPSFETIVMDDDIEIIGRVIDAKLAKSVF